MKTQGIKSKCLAVASAIFLNRVTHIHNRTILTKRGRVVCALVSGEDLALLEQLEDARDSDELRQAIAADDARRVSSAELLEELEDTRDADELRQAIAVDEGRQVISAEMLAELDGELPKL